MIDIELNSLLYDSDKADYIVSNYTDYIYSQIKSRIYNNGYLVEESFSITMSKILRNVNKIDITNDNVLKAYLGTIATNTSYDLLKKNQKLTEAELSDGELVKYREYHSEYIPVDNLLAKELKEKIALLILVLSPKLRNVMLLKTYFGLSDSEIAKELNITESAARKRLERARAIIRKRLQGGGYLEK